jgi:chromosome partitioning protein
MTKVISIFNQKGGVGKTTTNVNLCTALALKGKKVLSIDIDPQGNTTSGFGFNKNKLEYTIYNVLIEDYDINKIIFKTEIENLDITPANIQLAGAEIELTNTKFREKTLREKINLIENKYDFIMVDCPPSLGLLSLNALTASNTVLIPIQCEYYSLEGVGQLIDTVKLVKKNLNPKLEIEGVILNMFDGRTNLSIQVVEEVKKYFKDKVYRTVIPRSIRLAEAPSFGQPIMLYDDKTKEVTALKDWLGEKTGVLSWKLDGLTIVMTYEGGKLVKAVTRGNGEVGEVVTNNAKVFTNIPLSIAYKGSLVLRGEAVISYSDFYKINETIPEAAGKYKNPRNLCSGSVRQLNNKITAERNVGFYAFSVVKADDVDFNNSRIEQLKWLNSQGFSIVEFKKVTQYIHTVDEIIDLLEDAGFGNIEIFDDYNEKEYSDTSMRAVFSACKFDNERT